MVAADPLTRDAIRSAIAALLPTGHPTIAQAARLLDVAVRTLQRRLNEHRTSYSRLVCEVRCETACRLLDAPRARIANVAAALGYADPSSFSRSFARWSGMQPRAYRGLRTNWAHSPWRPIQ